MREINFRKLRKSLFKALVALSVFLIPSIVSAQLVISGPSSLTNVELDVVLERIIIGIVGFIALLGMVFLVYGGIRYVTAGGNDKDMEEAKTIITYAIWGLFLSAAAYAIVKTVVATIGS